MIGSANTSLETDTRSGRSPALQTHVRKRDRMLLEVEGRCKAMVDQKDCADKHMPLQRLHTCAGSNGAVVFEG